MMTMIQRKIGIINPKKGGPFQKDLELNTINSYLYCRSFYFEPKYHEWKLSTDLKKKYETNRGARDSGPEHLELLTSSS